MSSTYLVMTKFEYLIFVLIWFIIFFLTTQTWNKYWQRCRNWDGADYAPLQIFKPSGIPLNLSKVFFINKQEICFDQLKKKISKKYIQYSNFKLSHKNQIGWWDAEDTTRGQKTHKYCVFHPWKLAIVRAAQKEAVLCQFSKFMYESNLN